ncbi:MAG: 3'-5' exonuclease, partial [Mesorhizobium sp.]|nr:3'-5' exonuclease [Mesorhizobium sp.]
MKQAAGVIAGATPLAALDAVAIDTETTGLDTSTARIIEIGAVALKGGAAFETLVDPGVPVPARSSAVHGITDATIAGAPGFAQSWTSFERFAAGRVLIGYSIGFDLAILAREAKRAGIAWTPPRTLCVRMLATLTQQNLPDFSLDTIAGWLGVDISGRHRAPGDARAAADVFLALLPVLRARGINTLAEAERACAALTGELETHHRAGWSQPVIAPAASPGASVLRAVDPFAYRHRVGDIMSAPPIVVQATATTRDVIALM